MKASELFKKTDTNTFELFFKKGCVYNIYNNVKTDLPGIITNNASKNTDFPKEDNMYGRHVWLPNKKNRGRGGF